MKRLKIKSKKNMYYAIFFSFLIFMYFASSYKGLNFPQEQELEYTTGVFDIRKNAKLSYHVLIKPNINSSEITTFSCAYTPFRSGRPSSCGDKKELKPYIGKEVTVGWYKQDNYFGFGSDLPQLVTIDVGSQKIRNYKQVVDSIDGSNSFVLYVLLPFSLFCPFLLYWVYGIQDKRASLRI